MKTFRSLSCLAGVCLVLFMMVSPANSATTAKPAASSVPVSVLGCPQGPPPPGLTPQYGGTLKLIFQNNPSNFGAPWRPTNFADNQCCRWALEGLLGFDGSANPLPQLATSWDVNPNNKTITFTLRQGVKFHDGTDFNAAAAKWNLDMYRNGPKTDLKSVKAVDAIDEYHLRLTLSTWEPLILNVLFSGTGRMVSPTAAQKLGDAVIRNPVGTGPFKFASYQPNVSLKYTRFEGYWQKGLPYLDGIEINFVADPVVALTSFYKGEAHVLNDVSSSNAKALKEKSYTIDKYIATVMGICGDSKNPGSPFSNIKVRQAIAYAIDNNTLVNSIFDNMVPPTNQLAIPGATAYDASIKGYPYNPAKAKELLASAGYSIAKPLTTKLVYASSAQRTDLFTAIQSNLAKVGINITLEPVDTAAFNKMVSSGKWDNYLMEYRFSYNGLEMPYSNSLSTALCADQFRYLSVWTPADFNDLYNIMLAENDSAKRDIYYQRLNKMAIDDYCLVVPIMGLQILTAKSSNVHDLGQFNKTAAEFLPERAWLSR
jgi:peptide/nickel transport system substrate-binding protein